MAQPRDLRRKIVTSARSMSSSPAAAILAQGRAVDAILNAAWNDRASRKSPRLGRTGPILNETTPIEADRLPFREWAMQVPEPKTGRLAFNAFPFQREWYSEEVASCEQASIMKSTQVGASSWLVRWGIYWADQAGKTSLYVFPADAQMQPFSRQRIAPLLRTAYLRNRIEPGAVNNVAQRGIGRGWLNLRGAQNAAGLESIDADVLSFDEYDLIPPGSIPIAERRVSSPLSLGLIRRIGWPSIDGYGMAKEFEQSDRRRWFVKCEHCNEHQFLRFFPRHVGDSGDGLPDATVGYVDLETAKLVCGKCRKSLSAEVVAGGEWVAEFPSRDRIGYHAHRMIVPGVKLAGMVEASNLRREFEIQTFWNRDLGEPYSAKEGRLSVQAIAAAQSAGGEYLQGPWDAGYHGDGLVTMGIDAASERNLNVRISLHDEATNTKRALFIGEVENYSRLCEMMSIYNVRSCVIDHLPDGRLANAFAHQFYGRVFVGHFLTGHSTSDEPIVWDPDSRKAGIRRTQVIDTVLSLIRQGRNHLPMDLPPGYVDQMRNVVRFFDVDEVGRPKVGYRSLGDVDFLMAEVYDHFAFEMAQIEHAYSTLTAETYQPLDDLIDFERSTLHDDREMPHYVPGPSDDIFDSDIADFSWGDR